MHHHHHHPPMLSGLLARLVKLLLGRHGSALQWRAAGAATVLLVIVLLAGSYLAVLAERGAPGAQLITYPRALWWSVETATTVGYGDLYPVTLWGRLVAVVVMVAGITSFGLVTAALATWFVGQEQQQQQQFVRHSEKAAEEAYTRTTRALHERFDRLERMLDDNRR
uniref:Voltage-gated potassium channel n=1 Tax=Streptomyces lividans TaxID=1916 RepID=UPI0002177BCE|nr:Chain K, Voltage-gated potassium channel [Streptomyces lividans]3PJS_L Chain L, Voltage-gated potassium channel [Streptomyces lividans]3PJS_M Chain M, Voltage-gated potassium channel [Streptomyces lividans]3PJS_N Chain N, Voltage-gated potassium channel [Streptomyces lividans]